LAFFGFGTIGSELSEIGSLAPTIVPTLEALVVNKDLLLHFVIPGRGATKYLFCHNKLGARRRIDRN
jgi:hypothetical protein